MIKGKPPEEIRKTFNIQNNFTPKEEGQIRRENDWTDLRGVTSSKNGRGRRSNLVKNSQEGRNLLKKTAEASVCPLDSNPGQAKQPRNNSQEGRNLVKKRPGCRDVPVVSSMSNLAIVDAFPCRVLHTSVAPELLESATTT